MSLVEGKVAAEILSVKRPEDLKRVAELTFNGKVVGFPFNGIFGLFSNLDIPQAAESILIAKNRPADKKLIVVALPEYVDELVDFSKSHYSKEALKAVWTDKESVHALGMILPASFDTPVHMRQITNRETALESQTSQDKITASHYNPVSRFREFIASWMARVRDKEIVPNIDLGTVLVIWTEYPPLRYSMECFRELGGRAWIGTSANKSGQPTHWRFPELVTDFLYDVAALVEDDFTHLPERRRKSTSIVDFTNTIPRFHRDGNVSETEIKRAFKKHHLPGLWVGRDVIAVRGKS